jgi:hypothetical protein
MKRLTAFVTEDGSIICISLDTINGQDVFYFNRINNDNSSTEHLFLSEQDLEFLKNDIESALIDYRQAKMQ